MGVEYIKGKVARIEQLENGNMSLHYEDMLNDGGVQTREFDLVSLTTGFLPNLESLNLFKGGTLETDDFKYVREVDSISEPGRTNIPGLFIAGTVSGVRDIPDTVLHSGSAAAQASAYVETVRND